MAYIHATAILLRQRGVLLRGRSGAGKSTLALGLMESAWQLGEFAALIGDDRVDVRAVHGRLIVTGHPAIYGQIERRGMGIETVPAVRAGVMRLVVDISAPENEQRRLPEACALETRIETVLLPRMSVLETGAASDHVIHIRAFLARMERDLRL
ncbi:MAG: hypothetical protein KGQ46_01100 [Hyphomicrobiales bacterium]|nr:hypothetical protein [Hyphomicrobiales bacterium]MDE2114093.1 hypothetical protein [Hyphomicrobiales bacterium]